MRNIQVPGWAWPFAGESWIASVAGSGSNPHPGKDPHSGSRSHSERFDPGHDILIVEDNSADVYLIRTALESAGIRARVHLARDGEQAMRYFDQLDGSAERPCPALVILDINLPKRHGGEVLQYMKGHKCAGSLVLVVSTSDSARDREEMARLGATGYFHKPSEYGEFMKLGGLVRELLGI
jgi:CheY-like chemotaxis protein